MKIRNISGEKRYVPELFRDVDADEIVTVPDSRADAYLCQPHTWAAEAPTPTTTKK